VHGPDQLRSAQEEDAHGGAGRVLYRLR
jgi:hypothetical protein